MYYCDYSQQHIPDHTTQFFALPSTKYDISLGWILSKGKGIFELLIFNIHTYI